MQLMLANLKSLPYLLLILFACGSASVANAQRSSSPPDKITNMIVSTIAPGEGDNGKPTFGNMGDVFEFQKGNAPVLVGPGSANYPVHYLLALVEVTGADSQPRVELTATEGRRIVMKKIVNAYVPMGANFSEPVKTYAVFFIEGDRCELLKLTARLVGPENRRAPVMTKAMQFGCGE